MEEISKEQGQLMNMLQINSTLLSNLRDSILNLSRNGFRDLVDFFGRVGYNLRPTPEDLMVMYRVNGIARVVVEAYSEFCWRELPIISEDKDAEESTPFEKAWMDLVEEHDLLSIFANADIKAGLGYWGVIYLGFSDAKIEGDLLNEVRSGSKLTHIRIFDYRHSRVLNWNADPTNPRVGKPEVYTLSFDPEDGAENKPCHSMNVHWSRCIHIPAGWKDSDISDTPRVDSCYNWLSDIMVILASSRIGYWNGGNPGVFGEIDKDAHFTPQDMDSLAQKVEDYTKNLKRFILGKGLKMNTMSPNVTEPTAFFETTMKAIAASTKIPLRVLLGTEMGILAGDQDSAKVASNITIRQRQYCEKYILRQFIDRMVAYGVLPAEGSTKKKFYRVEWSNLYALKEQEQASVGEIYTRALVAYANSPALHCIISPVSYLMLLFNIDRETAQDYVEQAEEVEAQQIAEEEAQPEGELPTIGTGDDSDLEGQDGEEEPVDDSKPLTDEVNDKSGEEEEDPVDEKTKKDPKQTK